jgi:hypothetical protein
MFWLGFAFWVFGFYKLEALGALMGSLKVWSLAIKRSK